MYAFLNNFSLFQALAWGIGPAAQVSLWPALAEKLSPSRGLFGEPLRGPQ